jgi:predicted nucleotide-binding protein (sugar kinase/HSP70/actin superfamily)
LSSAVTGYGEELLRTALGIDYGIVETMAHLAGAQYIDPQVSFILDIGGQDMKSMFVNDGVISNIELNEACSSGCGSFLQNFASTMNLGLDEFSRKACLSKHPSDLGSRCTVFMNSKVKQSLREGAGIDDIAAGLAYSVVNNCLFKVLKISNLNMLGEHIVVQGGTFRNDAVYRALELLSGKSVGMTDYPELMGAFGAALYAFRQWETTGKATSFAGEAALKTVVAQTSELHCKACTNQCAVVKLKFPNGNICYAGNKCEKVFSGTAKPEKKGINAFELKNEMIFTPSTNYTNPAGLDKVNYHEFNQSKINPEFTSGQKSKIGIPRVLNMFDDFPFWNALFTDCGYEVVLSPESTVNLYKKGVASVMSDNICFPAKLAHGHILTLLEQKPDRLFYPLIPKVEKEFHDSSNSYNCPVVSGYPDVIRSAIDPEGKFGIPFDTPVIGFNNEKTLEKTCWTYFSGLGVERKIFDAAFRHALTARNVTRKKLIDFQKNVLQKSIREHSTVFVVAGRPYHTDPLIHQKTGQILADLGVDVLTDDVFRDSFIARHSDESQNPQKEIAGQARNDEGQARNDEGQARNDGADFGDLNVVSQWSYPNRVIQTALQVAKLPRNVQMIQLNSFGCGPDSFLMDEVSEILKKAGKNLTVIRIDEIASPGSVRLRLRSLVESLKVSSPTPALPEEDGVSPLLWSGVGGEVYKGYSAKFEKKDKQKTILIPWFADFISPFVPAFGELAGYKFENLPPSDRLSAELGLKYGHNEVCYPSTLVLGDIIKGLQSGKYDLDNTAVAITQTGGQCRATNYIAQIKTGLTRAGFGDVPVISIAAGKSFQNAQTGFQIPWLKLLNIAVYAALYGDALNQMYSAMSVREKTKGESRKLFDLYMECGSDSIARNDSRSLLRLLEHAVADFNMIRVHDRNFTKIGFIGEIFVKYNNYAQAHISEWLRERNMEVMTPPILDFIMQYFVNTKVNDAHGITSVSLAEKMLQPVFHKYMNIRIEKTEAILKDFRFYAPSESIFTKAAYAEDILHLSNQFGEGWMLPAEVASYARQGINKVVCIQPFGCIANHIVAKGVEKRLKKFYPEMDLLYLDIDSGIAEVNLQNRLHFMMEG